MHRSKNDADCERIDLFFGADEWSGHIKNAESEKCEDLGWFPLNKFPKNIIPHVKQAVDNIGNKIYYSEFGF